MKYEKKNIVKCIFIIIILCILVWSFLYLHIAKIDSSSMMPTLIKGDKILYIKKSNPFLQKGDIVLFDREEKSLIKRCTALPGEKIYLSDNQFHLRLPQKKKKEALMYIIPKASRILKERDSIIKYQKFIRTAEKTPLIISDKGKVYLGKEEIIEYEFKYDFYFVEGDNRRNSIDSRYFGPISSKLIKGKMIFKLF